MGYYFDNQEMKVFLQGFFLQSINFNNATYNI